MKIKQKMPVRQIQAATLVPRQRMELRGGGSGGRGDDRRLLRKGRDSNSRYPFGHTRFPGVPVKPLLHLSMMTGKNILQIPVKPKQERRARRRIKKQNAQVGGLPERFFLAFCRRR